VNVLAYYVLKLHIIVEHKMANLIDKVKEKMKDARDKVVGSKDEDSGYDSTKHYEASEPMSPAKLKNMNQLP